MTIADWVGVVTTLVAVLGVVYKMVDPVRQDLEVCKRERIELRRRLELVTAAIIGTLPREQRIDLLTQLGDRVPPYTDEAP